MLDREVVGVAYGVQQVGRSVVEQRAGGLALEVILAVEDVCHAQLAADAAGERGEGRGEKKDGDGDDNEEEEEELEAERSGGEM